MSYILDALKKSEQQRNGEDLPEWNQEEVATPKVESKQNPRLFIAALVLLLPILLWLIYWVFFKSNDDAGSDLSSGTDLVEIEIVPESEAPAAPIIAQKSIKKISLRDFNKAQGIEEKPKSAVIFSKDPLDVASTKQANSKFKIKHAIVTVFELPESIQRTLPTLKFSGHVYSSDNVKRHIMINSQRLKEGDAAAAGILVDKITVSGAEFTFKDRRFSLNALQDWEGLK